MSQVTDLPGAGAIWTNRDEWQDFIQMWDSGGSPPSNVDEVVLRHIAIVPHDSILDLGCGIGRFHGFLEPAYYTGVDGSIFMVEEARRRFADDPTVDFAQSRVDEYQPTAHYELALLVQVLQHNDAPETLLAGVLKNLGSQVDYLAVTGYIHDDERQYLDFGDPAVTRAVQTSRLEAVVTPWKIISQEDIPDPAHATFKLRVRVYILQRPNYKPRGRQPQKEDTNEAG